MKLLLALSVALLALLPSANFAAQQVIAQDKITPNTRQSSGIVEKSDPAVINLINQGKSLYKSQKFKEALEKFETVIRLEPRAKAAKDIMAGLPQAQAAHRIARGSQQ